VGSVQRRAAGTAPLETNPGEVAELYVVVEGERDGLPVYACDVKNVRIQGRAIPERLILTPQEAGLADAEVQWMELRSIVGDPPWRRTRLPRGENRWSLSVMEFHGSPGPGMLRSVGTSRYAAAVRIGEGDFSELLETDGWSIRPDWRDPERSPGMRVSRNGGTGLGGHAMALARLPVRDDATVTHAREKVALRPIDLVLAAYEDDANLRLRETPDRPLDSEEWSWLFETVVENGKRRDTDHSVAILPTGKPIPWIKRGSGEDAIRKDDVLLLGDQVAILQNDNGDGWLGNDDDVLHVVLGEVALTRLSSVSGNSFSVVRARDFAQLRTVLREAGYGQLMGRATFGNDLMRAIEEFERDHDLPVDGKPDPEMEQLAQELVVRMRTPFRAPDAESEDTHAE
jgi:hypothetical protein